MANTANQSRQHKPGILNESVCTLQQAREMVPTKPHVATIWNWTRKAGNRLESCRIGGRIVTSREAVQRFLEQQNQGADQ